MNRSRFFLPIFLLGLCLCLAQALSARAPNIIFILADDLGYGDLGCYGQDKIRTPNVDRIANEGMKFTAHYSGSPVCAPSRCVLMTGKDPGHAFVRNNRGMARGPILGKPEVEGQLAIPDEEVTIAEVLKQAG